MHQILRSAYSGHELDLANALFLAILQNGLAVHVNDCKRTLDQLVVCHEDFYFLQDGEILELDMVDIEKEILLITKAFVPHTKKKICLVYRYLP